MSSVHRIMNGEPTMVSVDVIEVGPGSSGEKLLSKFFVEDRLTGSQLVFRREGSSATGGFPYGFLNSSKTELFVFPENIYGPYISRSPVNVLITAPQALSELEHHFA